MDDNSAERTLKIKINGVVYPAAPMGQAQVMALQMVKGVSPGTVIKILSSLLKFSLGEDAQSDVLVMLASGDIDERGLIAILMDIATATAAEKEAEREKLSNVAADLPAQPLDGTASHVPATFGNGQG